MPLAIVTFYAGLNALIALVLGLNVVRLRFKTKINLGTGGNPALEQAIRAHGNCIEYVPFILLLVLLLALGGLSALWLHILGGVLTIARVLHAWGLLSNPGESLGRSSGITLTWLTMLAALFLAILRGVASF
jgi:uncharacterized membrane protein YecN with MAPEG domain